MKSKVLIVDDEPDFLELVADVLEAYGMVTLPCKNAEEALIAWVENSDEVALVITDANMPGLNGFQFANEIHAADASVPLLVVSGMSEKEFSRQYNPQFPYLFFAKPLDFDKLVEIVKAQVTASAA
ncbi:MAG: response regulator [Bdellovibrionales bacterium]|nr:response regulator [Bdellovibrionales bacterium]